MTRTIAIDGPSGAGKSTIGFALAARIDATFVDTGLMYRALTLAALERGIDVDDGRALGALAGECRIDVERPSAEQTDRLETVRLDGRDVTLEVRTPPIDRAVSAVSRHAEVRSAMLGIQRAAADRGDTVMVGRDIGTVVLPDADLKIYLDASVEERARRRTEERGLDPAGPAAIGILEALRRRDHLDATRAVAPLRVPEDARIITTDGNAFDATVAAVVATIRDVEARRADAAGAGAAGTHGGDPR